MTATLRFDGQVVVVTGGARGIGRSCVELLAERGAQVLLVDTGTTPTGQPDQMGLAHDVARALGADGYDVVASTVDASRPAGVQAVVTTALERWGRVDAIVANAG